MVDSLVNHQAYVFQTLAIRDLILFREMLKSAMSSVPVASFKIKQWKNTFFKKIKMKKLENLHICLRWGFPAVSKAQIKWGG